MHVLGEAIHHLQRLPGRRKDALACEIKVRIVQDQRDIGQDHQADGRNNAPRSIRHARHARQPWL
jgi:hypothetical protein